MKKQLLRIALCGAVLHGTAPAGLYFAHASAQTVAEQAYNAEQLDALLAPIALYPDALLTQVLMGSTFPLQVVSAGRWVDDPANKGLSGDALAEALEARDWDPSVKSLVPFPSVLALLNGNLEWTQQLGYAFAEDQAGVMNAVQRLRFQAQEAGNLQTNEQQVVRVEQQTILIEPAQPSVVYVPNYNPTVVYGAWPYPAYPPVYLPPPPGYVFGAVVAGGIAFAAGVAVVGGLYGWARPGWGYGRVNVNVNQYNTINVNRARINSATWQPNRPGGRPAGLQRPPNGPVGQPARPSGLPANAVGRPNVKVPASAVNKPTARPIAGQVQANRPGGGNVGQAHRPSGGQAANNRAGGNTPAASRPAAPAQRPAAAQRPAPARQPPALSGIDSGRQAAQNGARGHQSRTAASQAPRQGRPNANAGAAAQGGAVRRAGR